jgi:ankyrin repeat protein
MLLLQCGATVNDLNGHKWSALMIACQIECLAAVKFLLEYGADVNICDKFGVSAFNYLSQLNVGL